MGSWFSFPIGARRKGLGALSATNCTSSGPLVRPPGYGTFSGTLEVAILPIFDDGIASFGQPYGVLLQFVEVAGCKELATVLGGFTERFQQPRRRQHGDFMSQEAEMPCGFLGCKLTGLGTKIEEKLAFGIHG